MFQLYSELPGAQNHSIFTKCPHRQFTIPSVPSSIYYCDDNDPNVLFVLCLSSSWYFIRPTFVIQTITAREVFLMRVTIKIALRNSLASRLLLSRASSKINPRLVMKQKRVREAMVELDYHHPIPLNVLKTVLSANLAV